MKQPSHPLFNFQSLRAPEPPDSTGPAFASCSVRSGQKDRTAPAKGWIAVGQNAYGIIFAVGAIAVAPVAIGALSIGFLAWGGFGIGLLAFGGMSVGFGACGGGAIGYVAYGGAAIGWLGAAGGAAMAHFFAQGGGALAEHANDQAARDFMRHSTFFRHAESFTYTMILLSWLSMGVPAYFMRRFKRRRHSIACVDSVVPGP